MFLRKQQRKMSNNSNLGVVDADVEPSTLGF